VKNQRVILFDLITAGHHIYYASYLINYLCEQGYQVMFVTQNEDERIKLLPQDEPNLQIRYIGGKTGERPKSSIINSYWELFAGHLRWLTGLGKCFRIAHDWRADAVQVLCLGGSELSLYLQHLLRRKRPWRLFAIMVKPYFSRDPEEKVSLLGRLYLRLNVAILKRMLEKGTLSGLFVHTDEIRDTLISRFQLQKRFRERILVVPDPVDTLYGRCSTAEARERLQLPQDIPVLLFFGWLAKTKGIDFLLEGIKRVRQDFRLVLAGTPEYITQADIDTYRQQLDDPDKIITRLEYIPDEEIGYYFLSADAVVLPYRKDSKGTSGVLQLAAAAGKPVIATDVGEIGGIAREHSLGIVVEAESADALREGIESFLNDRENMMNTVLPNALKYAEQSHWKKFASLIESAYRSGESVK